MIIYLGLRIIFFLMPHETLQAVGTIVIVWGVFMEIANQLFHGLVESTLIVVISAGTTVFSLAYFRAAIRARLSPAEKFPQLENVPKSSEGVPRKRLTLDTANARGFFWVMSVLAELGAITLIGGATYNLQNPIVPLTSYDLARWWGLITFGCAMVGFFIWNQVNDLRRFGLHRVEAIETPEPSPTAKISTGEETATIRRPPPGIAIPVAFPADPDAMKKWTVDFRQMFSRLTMAEKESASKTFDEFTIDISGALQRLFPTNVCAWDDEVRLAISELLKFIREHLSKEGVSTIHTIRYVNWICTLAFKNDELTFGLIRNQFQQRLSSMFHSGVRELETDPDFIILSQEFNQHLGTYMTGLVNEAIKWDGPRFSTMRAHFDFKKMNPEARQNLIQHLFEEKLKADKSGDDNALRNVDALYQDAVAADWS